jgi:hypothetical protein
MISFPGKHVSRVVASFRGWVSQAWSALEKKAS